MLMQNKAAIDEIIRLEEKIAEKYKTYAGDVESGEVRKMCEDLISRHNLHIEILRKYVER